MSSAAASKLAASRLVSSRHSTGFTPAGAPIDRSEAACLTCHRSTGSLSGWARSSHHRSDVSCMSCHEHVAHRGARERSVQQMESCGECHRDVVSEFRFPNHHRVPEGALACSDCHNPHETVLPTHDRELRTDSCVGCHREKAGPFVYAHNADRVDGCVVCHEPHGSLREAMLKVEPPRLCQSCHVPSRHPTEARQPGNKFVIGRACLSCHQKIHGSNHPSGFAFTR